MFSLFNKTMFNLHKNFEIFETFSNDILYVIEFNLIYNTYIYVHVCIVN